MDTVKGEISQILKDYSSQKSIDFLLNPFCIN